MEDRQHQCTRAFTYEAECMNKSKHIINNQATWRINGKVVHFGPDDTSLILVPQLIVCKVTFIIKEDHLSTRLVIRSTDVEHQLRISLWLYVHVERTTTTHYITDTTSNTTIHGPLEHITLRTLGLTLPFTGFIQPTFFTTDTHPVCPVQLKTVYYRPYITNTQVTDCLCALWRLV